MRYETDESDQSQDVLCGAFRTSGLPDTFEQDVEADKIDRQCHLAEQELAEQAAESAILGVFTEYGRTSAAGVIRRALQRASNNIATKGRMH